MRLPDVSNPHFRDAYDAARAKPGMAAAPDTRTVAALCKLYLESGEFKDELKASSQTVRRRMIGHIEVERGTERWQIGTPQRLAFELIFWTGARCIDARVLGRQMVDRKGWLGYVQEKTGGAVAIPLFAPLPGWCAEFEPDRQMLLARLEAHRDMTFIVTRTGSPRSQKGISQWIAANARAAGLTGLTAHGLRASRAIELYLIGATSQKIGAWTGHLSLSEIEHYTRAASRRALLAREV